MVNPGLFIAGNIPHASNFFKNLPLDTLPWGAQRCSLFLLNLCCYCFVGYFQPWSGIQFDRMLLANLTVRFNLSNCAGLINFTLMLNKTWFFSSGTLLNQHVLVQMNKMNQWAEGVSQWVHLNLDSSRLFVSHPCPHGMPTYCFIIHNVLCSWTLFGMLLVKLAVLLCLLGGSHRLRIGYGIQLHPPHTLVLN